ncbi:MAG: Polyamine aminopropyltransferase [Phycisphaerae bacterium]|nr:Polyamine aminopropyltransferase [Phycisphaerae bacterium]
MPDNPAPATQVLPPVQPPTPRAARWLLRVLAVAAVVVGLLGVRWACRTVLRIETAVDALHRQAVFGLGIGAIVAGGGLLLIQRRVERVGLRAMDDFTARIDRLTGSARGAELVIVSLLGLFLEVLLIRWHATELRAAAYFKNVTLLASFLGLGLGFAAANRARLAFMSAPIALAIQIIAITVMGRGQLDDLLKHPSNVWLWGVAQAEFDWTRSWWEQRVYLEQAGLFYGFFAALYVSTILIFLPIGQLTGRLMRGVAPIRAYTLNIVGSLAGVALFGAVSFLWLPPVVWFGLAGLSMCWLARHEPRGATSSALAMLLALISLGHATLPDALEIYSPYQRLEVTREVVRDVDGWPLDTGVLISANKAYHLRTANLADEFVGLHGERFQRLRGMQAAYNRPYRFVATPAEPEFRVLVVGAGGGNDVAAALRNGATHVDAVEIDPAILELGRRYHAEQPYSDPRVSAHVNDARAFMRRAAGGQYDLIVFGLLDSHTLLSGMSAVRLDNFVYTVESLREARRLLKPRGVAALSFATGNAGYLATRLHDMLKDAFGHEPRCIALGYDDGMMFLASAADDQAGGSPLNLVPPVPGETAIQVQSGIAAATDDWPFLYLPGPRWEELPRSYLVMVGILALISVVWVLAGSGRVTGVSPHFFFLGGAFLLIETKGITELALVFGTTWIVSSVVIAAILALILLANSFVTVWPAQHRGVHYVLLAASLIAGYFVRIEWLLHWGWAAAACGATVLLVLPLFFAGVIFATSLTQAASLPRAFASNLLGAILGGLCEYSSMALGFRNLYLVGLGLYALSFVTLPRRRVAAAMAN